MEICFRCAAFLLLLVLHTQFYPIQGGARIVGGDNVVNELLYPFYATPANNYLCGASVVHGDILVTAAHCGQDAWKDGIWLRGTHLNSKKKKFYPTAVVIIHPKYNSTTMKNDIALIKINGFVNKTTTMHYGILNYDRFTPHVGDMMTVIGHGLTAEDGEISANLMSVDVEVATYAYCHDYFNAYYNYPMLCQKGLTAGGKDACYGDSGGPVFLQNTTTIVGIVSFGNGCGRPDTPSVNTRISSFSRWILKHICLLSSNPTLTCPPWLVHNSTTENYSYQIP
jgi:secreted trypsin-like serine protease